ncbi:hypothetical protein ABZS81_15010, partial [Streptomyces sp. NPDC005318]
VTAVGSVVTTAVVAVPAVGSVAMIGRRVVTTTVVGTAGRVVMMSVVGVPVVASSDVTTGRVGPVATTTAAPAASAVTTAAVAVPVVVSVVTTVGPRAAVTAAGSVVTTAAVAVPAVVSVAMTAVVAVPAGSRVMIGRRVVMMSVVDVPVVALSDVTTGRVGPVATTTAAPAASAVTTAVAAVDTADSGTTVTGVDPAGATTVVASTGVTTGTGSRSSGCRFPTTSPVTRSTRTCDRSC